MSGLQPKQAQPVHAQHARVLMRLAWPAIAEQILLTLVSYVDTAMVGVLGADATAAVAINASPIWLIGGLLQALAVGFSVQVAHRIGAGDPEGGRAVIRQAVVVTVSAGLLLMGACLLLAPYLPRWMGAQPAVLPDAVAYFRIYVLALPMQASSAVFSAILRCKGDTRTPLVLNTITNLANVCLNFLLIYPSRTLHLLGHAVPMWGAGLGVSGAAIATSISTGAIGVCLMAVVYVRKDALRISLRECYRPDAAILRRALALGLPVALERTTISLGQIVMTRITATLGTVALAANHVAVTAEGLSYLPASGISYAATTLVGQRVGARESHEASRYARLSGWFGLAFSAGMGALLFVLAHPLSTMFSSDPAVVSLAAGMLRIVAAAEPPFCVSLVLGGALRGAGDSRFPFVISMLCMWGIRATLAPLCVFVLHTGLAGIWIAMAVDLCTRGALSLWRVRRCRFDARV